MAIIVQGTNYNGEVLERILTVATTSNDLVERGLIMVIPGVQKKISVPRVKTGKMLQKRKANPTLANSKGDLVYSERALDPKDMMAFTTFNPATFEYVWRRWQPKGNLVFSQLPPEAQNILVDALSKQLRFELGWHYINGEYGDDDDHLMDGILTQAAKDHDCIVVDGSAETTMIGKLYALRDAIPTAMRTNSKLRFIMGVRDFDRYDKELTNRDNKNASETDINAERFKGITIEVISSWPDGVLVATLCSLDADGNLFAAVNLQDDEEVIQIDKYAAASELYFFKLLMKADTNIAFGEEFVVMDTRTNPKFKPLEKKVTATPSALSFAATGEIKEVSIEATGDYTVDTPSEGFTVERTATGLKVTASANEGESARNGKITVTLDSDKTKTATITLSQPKA